MEPSGANESFGIFLATYGNFWQPLATFEEPTPQIANE